MPNFNSKSQYTVWDLLVNLCHISCDSYSVFLVIAGISTLAAYMGGADQFHSIGWYNVAIGGALLFLLIALFRGECEWKKPEMNCTTTKCSTMKSNKTQALTGSVVNKKAVNSPVYIYILITSSSGNLYTFLTSYTKLHLCIQVKYIWTPNLGVDGYITCML